MIILYSCQVYSCGAHYYHYAAIVGFEEQSIVFMEGNQNIGLVLSVNADKSISIPVQLTPSSVPGVTVMHEGLMFATGSSTEVCSFVYVLQ